jgi:hypothetical protein
MKTIIENLESKLRAKEIETRNLLEEIREEREKSRIENSNYHDYCKYVPSPLRSLSLYLFTSPFQASNEELRLELLQKEQKIADLSREV